MKIGILTFHNIPNYGAMLQAYALWKYLEEKGHDVLFINCEFVKQPALWHSFCARSLTNLRRKICEYFRFQIVDFSKSFPQTRSYKSFAELKRCPPSIDIAIVGSDQMWNPSWALNSIDTVFLNFLPKSVMKVSYAVSFGGKTLDNRFHNKFRTLIAQFSSVSVREQSGIGIVKKHSGIDAVCLLDPSLLWTSTFYDTLITDINDVPDKPYLFYYILAAWRSKTALEELTLQACLRTLKLNFMSHECPPSCLAGSHLYKMGIISHMSVTTWLSSIAHADFVLTNSFHGTAFAAVYHKPFLTILLDGVASEMNDRVTCFLEKLGLSDRAVSHRNISQIDDILHTSIIWDDIDDRLTYFRSKTDKFFDILGI